MGKISLDLSSIKAAGVYTIEIDNSTRTSITTNAVRLCVGFSNKGPFNRPVLLQRDSDRTSIYGDIDTKLEHKGCFFNRALRTLISNGPVLALNLLKVDDSYNGADQVNYAAMSLNAGKANPKVDKLEKYAEYDYLADTVDFKLYQTTIGDNIPFVGTTPYASLYNRARFWEADKELLSAAAARGLNTTDYTIGSGSYEHGNLLNFANVGTEEISVLAYKAENVNGYDITAESWYGGKTNIPFGWIRPGDYISDYFITVVCVKGNWTNYSVLSTDPLWSAYFDKKGVIKSKISNFMGTDGVTLLGSWTGCIIPDFIDKQGSNLSIERKINAVTEKTGLLMSFNEDAAQVLNYDYSGADADAEDPTYGTWGYDIDGDNEIDSASGESATDAFIVDMVGHEVFKGTNTDEKTLNYKYVSLLEPTFYNEYNEDGTADTNSGEWVATTVINKNVFDNTEAIALMMPDAIPAKVTTQCWSIGDVKISGKYQISGDIEYNHSKTGQYACSTKEIAITTDQTGKKVAYAKGTLVTRIEQAAQTATVWPTSGRGEMSIEKQSDGTWLMTEDKNFIEWGNYASGVYLPVEFINTNITAADNIKATPNNIKNLINNTYYILSSKGRLSKKTISDSVINIRYYNYGHDNDQELQKGTNTPNNVMLAFVVNGQTYFVHIYVYVNEDNIITGVEGGSHSSTYAVPTYIDFNMLTKHDISRMGEIGADVYGTNIAVNDTIDSTMNTGSVQYVLIPDDSNVIEDESVVGVNFLSYNYIYEQDEEDANPDPTKKCIVAIKDVYYFNDKALWDNNVPVTSEAKNMFIVTNNVLWEDKYIKVGDFVRNITYFNNLGETMQYKLIPGITRIVKKQFVIVNNGKVTWKGNSYDYSGPKDYAKNGSLGFYLFTTTDPVLIETGVNEVNETNSDETTYNFITRQLPLSDDAISHSLRFIPMKGLKLSSRHRPGYDEAGNISIEGGIEKIYSVLEDTGIHRGLCNEAMVDFRYIIDTFSYGLRESLGGKVYLTRLAQDRGKCTALLNMPSAKQFAVSTDPYFCDSYIPGTGVRPGLNTKYIPEGGNTEMGSPNVFGLPNEDDGAKFAAAFFPNLIYSENGRTISVPPAADVANVFYRKFTGVNDPYAICANQNGIISNRYVTGLEFDADTEDREYLEPMGVNTIIRDRGQIMIYGNQTCFQAIKSDFNKLHVRENLNTMEIECNAILKQYNFLYNTPATRAAIVQMLTPVLSTMQTSGALAAYEIICDETNNTPDIIEEDYGIVDIAVWFNHGMEKIVQRITVNRYNSMSE